MRSVSIAVLVVISLFARTGHVAPKAASLAKFIPAKIDGIEVTQLPADMAPAPPDAVGAYLDQANQKSININLMRVKDLKFSKAQFKGLKPGETSENPTVQMSFKGFEVAGIKGQRAYYQGGSQKSEAILLLANKVDVMVSVEPTDDPDAAIAVLKQLDLKGLLKVAKKLK